MKKKILCIVFALLIAFSVFPLSIFANEQSSVSEVGYMDLSNTEIVYDFKYIFANRFNVADFIPNSDSDGFQFITAMESKGIDGNAELYFYVYNPLLLSVRKQTDLDNINISVYSNVDDKNRYTYSKENITLVKTFGATKENSTETNALLLKYKFNTGRVFDSSVERIYNIGDIELLVSGDSTATHFVAGTQYKFFNDSNGYVHCNAQNLTTLEMDAFHTFYRVNTEGVDEYTDIQSVYFPVPNEYLRIYGSLSSMHLLWDTYRLNPSLVVDGDYIRDGYFRDYDYSVLYDSFYPNSSYLYSYFNRGFNVPKLERYIYYDENTFLNPNMGQAGYRWTNSPWINPFAETIAPTVDYTIPITFVFHTDSDLSAYEEKVVDGNEIIELLNLYGWADSLFYYKPFHHDRTFYVKSYDNALNVYETCSGWERMWHGDVFEKDTGEKVVYSRFEQVDLSHLSNMSKEEFSKHYKIDINDVSCDDGKCNKCFSCNTSKDEYSNCTWFLLRYDTTDYKSFESSVIDNRTGAIDVCNSFVFETEVIRNFDTISIGFKNVRNDDISRYSVFPIGRSPTNFSADVWTPSEKPAPPNVGDLGRSEEGQQILKILKIIIFIALVVVAVVFLFKVYPFIAPVIKRMQKKKLKKLNRKDE